MEELPSVLNTAAKFSNNVELAVLWNGTKKSPKNKKFKKKKKENIKKKKKKKKNL